MRYSEQMTYDVEDRQHVYHKIGDIHHPKVEPSLVRGLCCTLCHGGLGTGEASEQGGIVRRSDDESAPSFVLHDGLVLHGEKGRIRSIRYGKRKGMCGIIKTTYSPREPCQNV